MPGLLDEMPDLWLDSELIPDILPLDACGLLADKYSCILDDLRYLVLELVLWGYVLFCVDAQPVRPGLLLLEHQLSTLLLFLQIIHKFGIFFLLTEVFLQ